MRRAATKTSAVALAVALAVAALLLWKRARTQIRRIPLAQPDAFYARALQRTRQYLLRVYPLAKNSLERCSALDIASVYNRLDFVYNCCYAYSGGLVDGGWAPLACCRDERNRMPYPPQGHFYFWLSYATLNIHTVYSDSRAFYHAADPRKALHSAESGQHRLVGSQRPDVAWGLRPDGGEIDAKSRSGPAPYWVPTYSFVRNIYYPFGPFYSDGKWAWRDGIDVRNADNMGIPHAGDKWAFGLAQGAYVEITHAAYEPGMVQSQGFWMTPFFGGGTGIFYRIGRTLVAVNKMDAVFRLVAEMAAAAPDMAGTSFAGMSGSAILERWFGTADPYTVVWKYCSRDTWPAMAKTASGGWLIVPKQWIGIDNKGVLAASGLFNKGAIGVPGKPYGDNAAVTFDDLVAWYSAQNSIPDRQESIRRSIDCARHARSYIMDRVCTIVPFDEPIFWLANVLGYETVQLTVSANGGGLWSPELIHTVVPNEAWRRAVKERVYPYITGNDADSMFDVSKGAPRYTMDGLAAWQDMIARVLTQRDPLDLSRGARCIGAGPVPGKVISYNDKYFSQWGNCSASDTGSQCWNPSTNDYGFKSPQCATRGQWGVPSDGAAVFPGRTFWGHYTGGSCYPHYENVFCDGGLSAEYSMLRIYTGRDLGA